MMKPPVYASVNTQDGQIEAPAGGFRQFLRHNTTILTALFAGFSCVLAPLGFTVWLSRQVLMCPDWAIPCHISARVESIRDNLATIQGLVTVWYAIGMAALAYAGHAFSESAVWPLLAKKPMTLRQMEIYLEASRGSITSSPFALFAARNIHSIAVVVCTVIITLAPLSSAPLVGYVYVGRNISVSFQSNYTPGGGIGPNFNQRNPSMSNRVPAMSMYASWASNIAPEPLPEFREWFIDRRNLTQRGSMNVDAVRMHQNISCYPWLPPKPTADGPHLVYEVDMRRDPSRSNHDKTTRILRRPRLTVWAHDYFFISPARTKTMLVFAALNGNITGGITTTDLPESEATPRIDNITTVACDVDVELRNDRLSIGVNTNNDDATVAINTLSDVQAHGARFDPIAQPDNTLNELILWFTVGPITNGVSLEGTQPVYQYQYEPDIPGHFTTPAQTNSNSLWTIPYIEKFIKVSVGASAIGDSSNWPQPKVVSFTSSIYQSKLDPSRPILLIIPPLVVLVNSIVLLIWNLRVHTRYRIPIMRLATLSEILKSSQNEDVRSIAAVDMQKSNQPSKLDDIAVQFDVIERGVWGLKMHGGNHVLQEGQELNQRKPLANQIAQ